MAVILTVLFSLATAVTNAMSATLQWHAAQRVTDRQVGGFRLTTTLLHRPEYLAALAALTASFLLQAAALSQGDLLLVQLLLVTELPFTLLVSAIWFRVGVDRGEVIGTAAVCVGLGVFIGAGRPHGGRSTAPELTWLLAGAVTAAVIAGLVVAGHRRGTIAKTVLYALAAGIGYALTALLVKASTSRVEGGVVHLLTGWEPYAMVVAGAASVLLTQQAVHAGPLAVAKPATTIVNPVASAALGMLVFHEQLAGGPVIGAEAAGALLLGAGMLAMCRSPLVVGRRADLGELGGQRRRRRQRRSEGRRRRREAA